MVSQNHIKEECATLWLTYMVKTEIKLPFFPKVLMNDSDAEIVNSSLTTPSNW